MISPTAAATTIGASTALPCRWHLGRQECVISDEPSLLVLPAQPGLKVYPRHRSPIAYRGASRCLSKAGLTRQSTGGFSRQSQPTKCIGCLSATLQKTLPTGL